MWTYQLSNDILMFSVWGRFVKRSAVMGVLHLLSLFEAYICSKHWGEHFTKTMSFKTIPMWHLQTSINKWCQTRDFEKWIVRPRSMHVDRNRNRVSLILLFEHYTICVALSIATISSKTEKERFSLYMLHKMMICLVIWQNLKVTYWIFAGTSGTGYKLFIEHLCWCHQPT